MKNVEEIFTRPAARINMHGAPPPHGWAVKYVSGMEEKAPDIKPGYWLQWTDDAPRGPVIRFLPEIVMTFDESEAARLATNLHELEIETVVEKVG